MKTMTVYESSHSGRQWRKRDDGLIETRGNSPTETWKVSGSYGVPLMSERDVDYYILSGDLFEVK